MSALMQGSVERFSQLLQVMTSANIVALTEGEECAQKFVDEFYVCS